MAGEISTIGTHLMYAEGDSTSFQQLCKIKDFPDLSDSVETIDVTDLTDKVRRSVPGVQGNGVKNFKANYVQAEYTKIKTLAGKPLKLGVFLGDENGSKGKFVCNEGYVDVRKNGGSVNTAHEMTVDITPNAPFELQTA